MENWIRGTNVCSSFLSLPSPKNFLLLFTCALPPSALSNLPWSGCFLSSFPWNPLPAPWAMTEYRLSVVLQASLHNCSVFLSHSSNPPNPFVVPPSPNSFLFFKFWLHKWKKRGGTWCVIECFSFILLKCQYRRIKYWTVCLWHLSQLACLSCFVSVSLQSPFFISSLKMLQGS